MSKIQKIQKTAIEAFLADRSGINERSGETANVYLYQDGDARYAYKEYNDDYKTDRGKMPQYLDHLFADIPDDKYFKLRSWGAFPLYYIYDKESFRGFIMDRLPDSCYEDYESNYHAGKEERSISTLLTYVDTIKEKDLAGFVITLEKIILFFHCRHIMLNDVLSSKNICIRKDENGLNPYLIDTDSMLYGHIHPLGTYDSPCYEPPQQEMDARSEKTDIYKFSHIVLRLFATQTPSSKRAELTRDITRGHPDDNAVRSLDHIEQVFGSAYRKLIFNGLSENPKDRPSIDNYIAAHEAKREPTIAPEACSALAERLVRGVDYAFDSLNPAKGAELTFQGIKQAESFLGIDNLNSSQHVALKGRVINAIIKKEAARIRIEQKPLPSAPAAKKNAGTRKPGPNDPCPCGSGLKYKNCHGKASGITSATIPNKDPIKSQSTNKPIQTVTVANNTDKKLQNKVKRIKASLISNCITAVLLIAIHAFNKFEVPASPWVYISGLIPIVAWAVYYFTVAIPFDEEYGCSKKYNKALYVVLVAVSLISICSIILTKLDKEIVIISKLFVIAYNLYYVPILALSTISCMKYLNEIKSSDQHISVYRNLSFILCSVLAVFVLIGTVKQVKGWNVLNVGDTVYFGAYEQDGDPSNGKEEISWTVHSIENGKALLLSDVCLYSMPYNASGTDNSWTNSDLRKWLNGEFYQSAFSSAERGVICDEEINTKKLSVEDLANGEPSGEAEITVDNVFVPDLSEFWMLTSELNVSDTAKQVFTANNELYGGENYRTMFWTRSPFEDDDNFATGYNTETEQETRYLLRPDEYAMVRPAIYVDVNLYSDLSKNHQEQAPLTIETSNYTDVSGSWSSSDNSQTRPHYYCYDDTTSVSLLGDGVVNFGPGVWVDSNEPVNYNSFVYQEFCDRLEHDPVMAAAVFAYVDKQLGTRYTGSFYSEIKDDWITGINNAAETFVNDMNLWAGETNAFEELLESTADISIIYAGGEEIQTLRMRLGDGQPLVYGPETLKTTAPWKYLCFTVHVKTTEITLSFLIDLGFQPVI